jgi:hypothetical protein
MGLNWLNKINWGSSPLGEVSPPSDPYLVSAVIPDAHKDYVILTFNKSLNHSTIPDISDFGLDIKTISGIQWNTASSLILIVTEPYIYTDVESVTYEPGTYPLEGSLGGSVQMFGWTAVTNNIAVPIVPPVLTDAYIIGGSGIMVVLTFDLALNNLIIPDAEDFEFSIPKEIDSVVISGNEVHIVLTEGYEYEDVGVTLSYTKGTKPITSTVGGEVESFADEPLTNNILPIPTISGDDSVCRNSSGHIYTTEANQFSYSWSINGGTINSGAGTNSVSVTWTVVGSKSISVIYTDADGRTANPATTKSVTVNALPTVSITGLTLISSEGTTTLSPTTGGTWISSDEAVATVDNSGNVTAVGPGTCTFTFTNTTTGCSATTYTLTVISPFITTWKTNNDGDSNSTSIRIPLEGGSTSYNIYIDWGDGSAIQTFTGTGSPNYYIEHDYGVAGTYTVKIWGSNFPNIRFQGAGDKQKILTIEQWGSNRWTLMHDAFWGCSNLTGNYSDSPDLGTISSLNYMFYLCSKFNSPVLFDTHLVAYFWNMFNGCTLFNQDISGFDFTACTASNALYRMLLNCSAFSTENYDKLLISLASQNIHDGIALSVGTTKYSPGAATTARDHLTSVHSWSITDGGSL